MTIPVAERLAIKKLLNRFYGADGDFSKFTPLEKVIIIAWNANYPVWAGQAALDLETIFAFGEDEA